MAAPAQLLENIEATHPRHVDVEDQAIAVSGPDVIEKRAACGKLARVKPLGFKQEPE